MKNRWRIDLRFWAAQDPPKLAGAVIFSTASTPLSMLSPASATLSSSSLLPSSFNMSMTRVSCHCNGYIGMVGRGSTIYTNPESNKKIMSTILDPQTQSNWVENELLSLSLFDGVVSLEPWNSLTKWKNTVKGTNGTPNSVKGTHHHGSPWPGMCVYDCICTMSIHVHLYVSSNNVLLVKIEGPVWYTIYHHLPVVTGVCPNPSINQPTNGKRTSMVSSIDIVTNKMSTKCIHIDMYKKNVVPYISITYGKRS